MSPSPDSATRGPYPCRSLSTASRSATHLLADLAVDPVCDVRLAALEHCQPRGDVRDGLEHQALHARPGSTISTAAALSLSAFAEMPRYRSNENLTSSAVTGSPLWNSTLCAARTRGRALRGT